MSAVDDYRKATHAWENTPMHDEDEVIAYGNAMEVAADAAIAEMDAENAQLRERLDNCLRGHYGLNPTPKARP
jgi:hypothetical protein